MMDKDEVVCTCFGVTVGQLQEAVDNGAKTFEEVQEATSVGTGCEACVDDVKEIVNQLLKK